MAKKIIRKKVPNESMIETAEENWKKIFDAGGNRLTPTRLGILELMWKNRKHLSAKDICTELIKTDSCIGLTTVYRNLDLLMEIGLVHKYEFGNGKSSYELSEFRHHYHLVCTGCGKIFDCEHSMNDNIAFTGSIEEFLSENYQFKFQGLDVKFYGRCNACKSSYLLAKRKKYLKHPPPRIEDNVVDRAV